MNDRIHVIPADYEPTEHEIAKCAYLLWLEQGRPANREMENWFAAKELLRHRHARSASAPALAHIEASGKLGAP